MLGPAFLEVDSLAGGGTDGLGWSAAAAVEIGDGAGEHGFVAVDGGDVVIGGQGSDAMFFFGDGIDPPDGALGGAAIRGDVAAGALGVGVGDDGSGEKNVAGLDADLDDVVADFWIAVGVERGDRGEDLFDGAGL